MRFTSWSESSTSSFTSSTRKSLTWRAGRASSDATALNSRMGTGSACPQISSTKSPCRRLLPMIDGGVCLAAAPALPPVRQCCLACEPFSSLQGRVVQPGVATLVFNLMRRRVRGRGLEKRADPVDVARTENIVLMPA